MLVDKLRSAPSKQITAAQYINYFISLLFTCIEVTNFGPPNSFRTVFLGWIVQQMCSQNTIKIRNQNSHEMTNRSPIQMECCVEYGCE